MIFSPSFLLIFILALIKSSFSIIISHYPAPGPIVYPSGINGGYQPYIYPHTSSQSANISSTTTGPHTQTSSALPARHPAPAPIVNPPSGFNGGVPPYIYTHISSQSANISSTTNAPHTQTSSAPPARSTTASHRGAGDPCGPQGNQTDFESTINTCGQINTTYTHSPSIYGVQCLNVNPSYNQSINTASCNTNIDDICNTIESKKATASQWNWSSGGPNCTLGVWFNPLPAAQPSRSFTTCQSDIYHLMQSTCFPSQGGQFNVAAVNLQTLPSVGTTGSQVDSGYPSYIIVPETYDNTNTGAPADEEAGDGDEDRAGGDEEAGDGAEVGPDGGIEGGS